MPFLMNTYCLVEVLRRDVEAGLWARARVGMPLRLFEKVVRDEDSLIAVRVDLDVEFSFIGTVV